MAQFPDPTISEDAASDDEAPVTQWLRRLEEGDPKAAEPLWEHFCRKLIDIARVRISKRVRGAYDEDDVAVSAFHSLCQGIQNQRFSLRDRDDLWRLLATISERKVLRRFRSETADRRDVRRNLKQSIFNNPASADSSDGFGLMAHEPCPAYAAEFAETCDNLMQSLPDEKLKQIAMLKLENRTDEEVASLIGCTRRTVQRKMVIIREIWQSTAENDS